MPCAIKLMFSKVRNAVMVSVIFDCVVPAAAGAGAPATACWEEKFAGLIWPFDWTSS